MTDSVHGHAPTFALTQHWGPRPKVSLYLDRCQVDTPEELVSEVWRLVRERRPRIGKVVDFGAGDARFARCGTYRDYVGYEIDHRRLTGLSLPKRAVVRNACAFSTRIDDADVCIGNPPFVRNQDLPGGWRAQAAEDLRVRTGVELSGLANAWQYFFLLSLASLKDDGLAALVVPFEWVSRPSALALRTYIKAQSWRVDVYRLADDKFDRVLTTSSITVIDKNVRGSRWNYFLETAPAQYRLLKTATAGHRRPLSYQRSNAVDVRATRGLSPGTQDLLVLTEAERARYGLRKGTDVVPCVTSLRHISDKVLELDVPTFQQHFVVAGKRCWLINSKGSPSANLRGYLQSTPPKMRNTATCNERADWWRFPMPSAPGLFVASGFRGVRPKVVINRVGARAVGSVTGVRCPSTTVAQVARALRRADLRGRIVSHSNGLKKVEVNQLNALLGELKKRRRA